MHQSHMPLESTEHAGISGGDPDELPDEQTDRSMEDIDKVIVAIHGIGSQLRGETIKSVTERFSEHLSTQQKRVLPLLPLGFFHTGKGSTVKVSTLSDAENEYTKIGFAEVYWADIPREVVKMNDTLEEVRAWGRTVTSRARARYTKAVETGLVKPGDKDFVALSDADFELGGRVLDEVIESIDVVKRLMFVFEKMDIMKFEIGPLLQDYLGDVQLVTEYRYYRETILARFHQTMGEIVAKFQNRKCELHIVAHSEGSVIAFLALLQALSAVPIQDPDTGNPVATDWVRHVRGFMTIGSPIDKHLVLWPHLWEGLTLATQVGPEDGPVRFEGRNEETCRDLPVRIKWRNYYDYGDPVGFSLDTAREFLAFRRCKAFQFEGKADKQPALTRKGSSPTETAETPRQDDFGFGRYFFPGKAHVDYWSDPDVFGHFIDDVVLAKTEQTAAKNPVPAPRSKPVARTVSYLFPYLLVLILHLFAVYALTKSVTAFAGATVLGGRSLIDFSLHLVCFGVLMTGVTVASRLPRLLKATHLGSLRWWIVAALVFAISTTPLFTPEILQFLYDHVQHPSRSAIEWSTDHMEAIVGLRESVLLSAASVVFISWCLPRDQSGGRNLLALIGASTVLSFVVWRLFGDDAIVQAWFAWNAVGVALAIAAYWLIFRHDVRTPLLLMLVALGMGFLAFQFGSSSGVPATASAPDSVQKDLPLWPVLLGGAAFLYLWKLATLFFDLTFVWHRYIRHSVLNTRMRGWNAHLHIPERVAGSRGGSRRS